MQLYEPIKEIAFDFSKLKGKIAECGYTNKTLSQAIGLTETTFSFKMNNKAPWKPLEIINLCGLLEIPHDQIHIYFFQPDYAI